MNAISRFHKAMSGEPIDRPLFTAMLSLYGAKLTGCPLNEYYHNADAYVEGQQAVLDTIHPDIVFAPFALPIVAEAFGHEVRYFHDQAPNLCQPAIQSPDEIDKVPLPDMDSDPRLLYFRQTVQKMHRELGDQVGIVAAVLNPIDFPILVFGLGNWLDALLFNPDGARRVLDRLTPFCIEWANTLLEDGVNCLAVPLAVLSPEILSPETILPIAQGILQETLPQIKGPIVLHHGGGTITRVLRTLHDISENIQGLAVDMDDEPGKALEYCGPNRFLMTGPYGPRLSHMSPEKIYSDCHELVRRFSDHERFILFTAGADVPLDTPVENIQALKEAVQEVAHA